MIGKSQLSLLSALVDSPEREVSVGVLADRLDWSDGHTSRVVSQLDAQGYLRVKDTGTHTLVSLSDIEPIEQLQTLLTEYAHVDFPELIAGSGLRLLYYLNHRRTASELAELSGVSRATVYRRLGELQTVGIVGKDHSHFQLNEAFSTLSSVARGLAHHEHRREAERYVGKVNILWETHDEYLFACDGTVADEHFHLTGPSLFEEFDIPLLTRSRQHYLRSDRLEKVTPAELVCHSLLIDDSSRYRTYCLLVIQGEGIERESLSEVAEYYQQEADIDLLTLVNQLSEYLQNEGAVENHALPAWSEFTSTAADYEIDI